MKKSNQIKLVFLYFILIVLDGCATKQRNDCDCKAQPIAQSVKEMPGRRLNFPLTYRYHASEGNSSLDGGRHAETSIKVSADGRVDIILHIWNRVALFGYCFNVAYYFEDAAGNVLDQYNAPQACVDGTHVPFAGPSNRQLLLGYKISGDTLTRVDHIRVVAGPGHKNSPELLAQAIKQGKGIIKIINE